MSGHSKWAQIKRKKEATDQKRGKLITQFAKQIALAARDGGDPAHNIKLAMAIDRAKSYNIPNDTIQRAVERGAGARRARDLKNSSMKPTDQLAAHVLFDRLPTIKIERYPT